MVFKQVDSLPSWQQQLQLLTCSQSGRESNQREKKKEDNPSLGSRKHNTSYSKIPENTGLVLGQALLPPSVLCAPTPSYTPHSTKANCYFPKFLWKPTRQMVLSMLGRNKKKNLPGYTSLRCDKDGHRGWPLTQRFHRPIKPCGQDGLSRLLSPAHSCCTPWARAEYIRLSEVRLTEKRQGFYLPPFHCLRTFFNTNI